MIIPGRVAYPCVGTEVDDGSSATGGLQRARPKSRIFVRPFSVRKMFSGFRSR
jgi:hypothetical protein